MSSDTPPPEDRFKVTATPTMALGEKLAALQRLHESLPKPGSHEDQDDSPYPAWDHPHPIHTVYGGAHLFKTQTIPKLGQMAAQCFADHCPDFTAFCHMFDLKPGLSNEQFRIDLTDTRQAGHTFPREALERVYTRIKHKLQSTPIEDYRLDFEDGLGLRTDKDEDQIAIDSARALLQASEDRTLAPLMGLRIKSFSTPETSRRAMRTLEIFLGTCLNRDPSRFPHPFIVTLPKVTHPTQVAAFVQLLKDLTVAFKLQTGQLLGEIMIESHEALLDHHGMIPLYQLVAEDQNMLLGVHFGAHDYLASLGCAGVHPNLRHPSCDFARNMIKLALSHTPLAIVDGAETYLPLGGPEEVKHGWSLSFANVWHALDQGIYQGWDLHPNQIPARLAAVYTYFITGLPSATARLKNFVNGVTQAARVGALFDDLATAQGLLNFFDRALRCGAITPEEARQTGLDLGDFKRHSSPLTQSKLPFLTSLQHFPK